MTEAAVQPAPVRKVGFLLGVGIVFLPIVFAWFLLRKGHSTLARVLGFGWLGLLVIAALNTPPDAGGGSSSKVANQSPASTQEAVVDRIGSPIDLGDITATVTSVRNAARFGNEYLPVEASDGGTLVAVTYSVKNTSAKPVKSYMMPKLKLIDPSGVEYNADIGKTGQYMAGKQMEMKIISDLNPGITTKDAQVFEVSSEQYDPATWAVSIDGHKVQLR